MRLLARKSLSKRWIIICCMILLFVFGNFLLFKNWSRERNEIRPIVDYRSGLNNDGNYKWRKDREQQETPDNKVTGNFESRSNDVRHDTQRDKQTEDVDSDSAQNNVAEHLFTTKPNTGAKKTLSKSKDFKYRMAILVIACNRPSVSRCLDQIYKYKPAHIDIPVIVSQDCGDVETEQVIKSYGNKLQLVKQPDLSDVQNVPGHMAHFMGYYKIARHYKFALNQAFKNPVIDSVVIIEDDLNIAPDFFEYFIATRPLLDVDKSLFCVSAWNDNGKEGYVKDNKLLYRSDFFPGLGWMLTRRLWNELEPKWPLGFWDDWLRNPDQRKNRACIRPEISRSKTFGRIGVSQGQFYDQYLKFIQLNSEFYPFRKADLSYLLKSNYDRNFIQAVYKKKMVNAEDVLNDAIIENAVRIQYTSNSEVESLARQFGLMTDLKAGVPRTAYKGIVSFLRNGKRIYLTPPSDWNGYIES